MRDRLSGMEHHLGNRIHKAYLIFLFAQVAFQVRKGDFVQNPLRSGDGRLLGQELVHAVQNLDDEADGEAQGERELEQPPPRGRPRPHGEPCCTTRAGVSSSRLGSG